MIIEINEFDTAIETEGKYDVIVTNVIDKEDGFVMTMKTKDGKVISEYIKVAESTRKLIGRIANLLGLYKSPVDTNDFIGKYMNISVVKHVNGTVKYVVNGHEKCAEPFTVKE